jgi:hypothetical protein
MHFTIQELYASATAKAKGIDNTPNLQQVINLVYLAAYVLEPLRVAMNEPIKIGSGFRCQKLNKAVGGVYNSQHMKGQAVDLCIDGDLEKGKRWFNYIKDHLPFDQLIMARYERFNNDYAALNQSGASHQDTGERMREFYGDTYWWYYYFSEFKAY